MRNELDDLMDDVLAEGWALLILMAMAGISVAGVITLVWWAVT
jgi:hypothetical protein